jgi:hypothetical protein
LAKLAIIAGGYIMKSIIRDLGKRIEIWIDITQTGTGPLALYDQSQDSCKWGWACGRAADHIEGCSRITKSIRAPIVAADQEATIPRGCREPKVRSARAGKPVSLLLRNTRKTVAMLGAPPEDPASSFAAWWRASVPFALLRNSRKTGTG